MLPTIHFINSLRVKCLLFEYKAKMHGLFANKKTHCRNHIQQYSAGQLSNQFIYERTLHRKCDISSTITLLKCM